MSVVSQHRKPVVVLMATVTLLAGGCSHSARATPKPSASPSATTLPPSASPTPDRAAVAASQAIAAYRATFVDVNEAVAHRNSSDPVLARHAGSSALVFLAATVRFYVTQDVGLSGIPKLRLGITSTSLSAIPPNVLLQACVDPRSQQHVDRRTGRPASGFILKPRPQTVLVQQHGGRWTVDAIRADAKRTC